VGKKQKINDLVTEEKPDLAGSTRIVVVGNWDATKKVMLVEQVSGNVHKGGDAPGRVLL